MRTTAIIFLLVIVLFGSTPFAGALEEEHVLSGADIWKEIALFENIDLTPGKWGFQDIALKDAEYIPDESTDCLIHFNSNVPVDASGNYSIKSGTSLFSPRDYMFGKGSAAFQANESMLYLTPLTKRSLFNRGNLWEDFSIEFWLEPVYLSENEVIFSWEGAANLSGKITSQFARCVIRNRKFTWELGNFFAIPEGKKTVTLSGIKELLPRTWHHHMLRFDAGSGLAEYAVDGIPESITHVTDTGKESGLVFRPYIGEVLPVTVRIGGNYTGFMDELRITRGFIDKPVLKKYANIVGTAESHVFDLGGAGSVSRRITVTDSKPGTSFVSYFIRSSDSPFSTENAFDIPWIECDPQKAFVPFIYGRYVQLAFTLYPDGSKTVSPRVSRVILVSEPKLPPPAPVGLVAIPGNGKVTLRWKRVNYEDVKGYRVYFGEEPGIYDGKVSGEGGSPIEAGNTTELVIEGLSNGTLYFFAVVAFDSEDMPNTSGFSNEASARPLGLYK